MSIELETIVKRSEDQIHTNLDQEVVVLNLQSSLYYGMDEVGAFTWEAISDPQQVGKVCQKVADEFNVPVEQCRDDIIGFLEKLEKAGLVKFESEIATDANEGKSHGN